MLKRLDRIFIKLEKYGIESLTLLDPTKKMYSTAELKTELTNIINSINPNRIHMATLGWGIHQNYFNICIRICDKTIFKEEYILDKYIR
jgi:hypothetical protein